MEYKEGGGNCLDHLDRVVRRQGLGSSSAPWRADPGLSAGSRPGYPFSGEGDKGTEWCPAVKVLPSYFGRCDLSAEYPDANSTRCL